MSTARGDTKSKTLLSVFHRRYLVHWIRRKLWTRQSHAKMARSWFWCGLVGCVWLIPLAGDAFRIPYAPQSTPLTPQLAWRGATLTVAPFIWSGDFKCTWWPRRRRPMALAMGKGDGKKRRKRKKSTASSASSEASSSQPAAPRVSNAINVPVRHQIRLAQQYKQQQATHGVGFRQKKVVRTKYRRTWDEEELELKAEERRRKGQDPDWDVILSRNASSPLVIVDGYNVIYQWPRLKKHMLKGDTARARQLLIDDLENLRSLKGWRIECVFDGTQRSTTGPLGAGARGTNKPSRADQMARAEVSKHGVRVVFTGVGVEADSYIEAKCATAKNVTDGHLTGSFIVATDDAMIRLAGQNAGALCMSAGRFVDELKASKKVMGYRVEQAVAAVNGHAIRPEKLRTTQIHRRFGRGSVVIEDKRNRTKVKPEEELLDIELNVELEEDENGVPWWAKVPNHTNPYRM